MYLCVTLQILPLMAYMRTRIPKKDLLFPYYHRIRDDGLWNVWNSNPLKTPYIVACFSSESEALAHAKHLNALYREESDATCQAALLDRPPPVRLWAFLRQFLRLNN